MTRTKQFFLNGLLITFVSLAIRGASVSFNVYLAEQIGAVAMGVFTLISTVYGFSVTLATSGIGLATTKLVAESLGKESYNKNGDSYVCRTVQKCCAYSLLFSISSSLLLYFLAPSIGICALKDPRTVLPLRILALSLPPLSLSSVFHGYFVAVRRVYKNVIVQVIGQSVRIFTAVYLLSILFSRNIESACIAISLGATLSEIIATAVHGILYFTNKRGTTKARISEKDGKQIRKSIWKTAFPVGLSAYVRSGLVTVEHMLIPFGLERSGASRDYALAAYGTVHSMVFPLVLFPSALSASFAGLLVPEIAEARASGSTRRIKRIIKKVIGTVLFYSVGVAGLLFFFSNELTEALNFGMDAGKYIRMVAPLVPIMYLDTAVDSLLKGLGEQVYCMGVNVADSLLSVLLVWVLLPSMGVNGYVLTVYFTETVNALMSLIRLLTREKIAIHPIRWIAKPLLTVVFSCTVIKALILRFSNGELSAFELASHMVLAGILYALILFAIESLRAKKQDGKI